MKFAAAIFDLDGTIIDSERAWGKAFVNVFKILGVNSDSNHPQTGGVSVNKNWESLISEYDIKTGKSIDELVTLTYVEYEKLIPEITLNEGALEFMDVLKENGTPLALATSTKWETTDKILEQFNLLDVFESVTTGEEVLNPKPAPDIFLIAAEKLGVEPADCLVFEDSAPGVISAKEAGMRVIAVNDDKENQKKLQAADLVVANFSEISLKAIDAIALD